MHDATVPRSFLEFGRDDVYYIVTEDFHGEQQTNEPTPWPLVRKRTVPTK
jgi:hypothetical protein